MSKQATLAELQKTYQRYRHRMELANMATLSAGTAGTVAIIMMGVVLTHPLMGQAMTVSKYCAVAFVGLSWVAIRLKCSADYQLHLVLTRLSRYECRSGHQAHVDIVSRYDETYPGGGLSSAATLTRQIESFFAIEALSLRRNERPTPSVAGGESASTSNQHRACSTTAHGTDHP